MPEAVWRSNHGMSPVVFKTQEPLFNNTVFRYDLMHQLFKQFEQAKQKIGMDEAMGIVATLGIKGPNYFECAPPYHGDNIMSIAYAPKVGAGSFYIAWEAGAKETWRPAACSDYVRFDLADWF